MYVYFHRNAADFSILFLQVIHSHSFSQLSFFFHFFAGVMTFFLLFTCFFAENRTSADVVTFFFAFHLILRGKLDISGFFCFMFLLNISSFSFFPANCHNFFSFFVDRLIASWTACF